MRILVLGGTKFVGRAISARLHELDHQLLLVHRGASEPPELNLPGIGHLHVDRAELPSEADQLVAFDPEAVVDVSAGNGADVRPALAALDAIPGSPDRLRYVAISSGDVYRAYEGLHTDRQTDGLPLTEDSPLRQRHFVDGSAYENLEIEPLYLERGGTVLRLGAVYGPHDYQRRFDFVLRRLRAGRKRIPIGAGTFLFSKVYVGDVADAVGLVLSDDVPFDSTVRGQAFNLTERSTAPFRLFAEQIVDAAGELGVGARLERVADEALPADLRITGAIQQHLLMDASRAREALGWQETDYATALRGSVEWHLANPPTEPDPDPDFTADDAALSTT